MPHPTFHPVVCCANDSVPRCRTILGSVLCVGGDGGAGGAGGAGGFGGFGDDHSVALILEDDSLNCLDFDETSAMIPVATMVARIWNVAGWVAVWVTICGVFLTCGSLFLCGGDGGEGFESGVDGVDGVDAFYGGDVAVHVCPKQWRTRHPTRVFFSIPTPLFACLFLTFLFLNDRDPLGFDEIGAFSVWIVDPPRW